MTAVLVVSSIMEGFWVRLSSQKVLSKQQQIKKQHAQIYGEEGVDGANVPVAKFTSIKHKTFRFCSTHTSAMQLEQGWRQGQGWGGREGIKWESDLVGGWDGGEWFGEVGGGGSGQRVILMHNFDTQIIPTQTKTDSC